MDDPTYVRELGGRSEDGRILHFGDADAETALAVEGATAVLAPLPGTTALRLTGSDRVAFLHGQLSSDVQRLLPGGSQGTLQLNVRGQVVGQGLLCLRPDDAFLALEDGRGPEVRASLEQHIVFDDVALEDLSGRYVAWTLQGAAAGSVVERTLGALPEEGRFLQAPLGDGEVLAVARARSLTGGYDLHLPSAGHDGALAALRQAGAVLVGERALDAARVAAGIASVAAEGGEHALPQELGLESVVAGDKGCYLGQEIMARLEARGSVRRRLARLSLEGPEAALRGVRDGVERALQSGGREVGRLGTVARFPDGAWRGLALVRRDLPGDAEVTVAGARARLEPVSPALP